MTTETKMDGSIESAIESIIAPIEEETVEATQTEEAVVTEPEIEQEIADEGETTEAEAEEIETEEVEEEISAQEQGDDDVDDNNDQEDASLEEPKLYPVKADGIEKLVTLEELTRSWAGEQHIQKGMQEAAAMKKEVADVYAALGVTQKEVTQQLELLKSGALSTPPVAPTKDMFENDPIGYMDKKMSYDDEMVEYDKQMAKLEQVSQRTSEAEQIARKAYLQQEMQKLQEVIPDFADADKAAKLKDRLLRIGQEVYGFSAAEISQITDHKTIEVLYDAVRYRDIVAGKAKAIAKVKTARPIIKAGAKKVEDSKNVQAQKRQQAKFKKTGSIDDAVGLIVNS